MENTMSKNYSISLIRFLSLLSIITCHILQGLNLEAAFWFNVGVQIFLFMSGFLYGQKEIVDPNKWFIKQFKKIYISYLILVIIIIFIDYVFFDIQYSKTTIVVNILGIQGFSSIIPTISHTWFVSYILLCYFITPVLQSFKFESIKNKDFIFTFLVILGFTFIFEYLKITSFNSAWIFTYILGYIYAKRFINKTKLFFILLTIATLILLIPRVIIQYNLVDINIPQVLINNLYYFQTYSHAFLGAWLFTILFWIFNKINIKSNRLLEFSDKYSYQIYLVHQIFILFHMSLLNLTPYLVINICLILICSILSGIILKKIDAFINVHIIKN